MGSCRRSDSVPSLGKGRAAGGLDAGWRWRWPHSADRSGWPPDRSEACCRRCNPSSPSLCCQRPALKHSNTASAHSHLSAVAIIYSTVMQCIWHLCLGAPEACWRVCWCWAGVRSPALTLLHCCFCSAAPPMILHHDQELWRDHTCQKTQHTALNHWHIAGL